MLSWAKRLGARMEPSWHRLGDRLLGLGDLPALRPSALTPRGELFFASAAVLAAGLLAMIWRLEGLLRSIHPAGGGRFGTADLLNPGFHLRDSGIATEGITTWRQYQSAVDSVGLASPLTIAHLSLGLDFAFALVAAALAAGVLIAINGRLADLADDDNELRTAARGRRRRQRHLAEGESLVKTVARQRTLVNVYRLMAVTALCGLPLYVLADWAEKANTWLLIDDLNQKLPHDRAARSLWFWPAVTASTLKWILVIGIAIAILVGAVALARFRATGLRRLKEPLVVIRAQLLLIAVFAVGVLGDPTGQAADALRRWADEPLVAVWATSLLVWLTLVNYAAVTVLLRRRPSARRTPPWVTILVPLAVVFAALGKGFTSAWQFGAGFFGLAIVCFVVALLSVPIVRIEAEPLARCERYRPILAPLLAALPFALLGLALVRASLPETLFSSADRSTYWGLWGGGVFLQLVALAVFGLARRGGRSRARDSGEEIPAHRRAVTVFLGISVLGAWAMAIAIWVDPWATGAAVGPVGILIAFLGTTSLLTSAFVYGAERVKPPNLFLVLRLRRIPVFTILAILAILAASLDKWGAYHDARVLENQPVHNPNVSSKAAFATWLSGVRRAYPKRKAIPIVFVASSGGGIRAALWTDVVLACVFDGADPCTSRPQAKPWQRPPAGTFFAASGVSGGSLGLVNYVAERLSDRPGSNWPDEGLDSDTLGPTLAWGLFVDTPMAFIRRNGGTDRAEVMERAWERDWRVGGRSLLETGLFSLGRDLEGSFRRDIPILVLNGTTVQHGCRFNSSVLDLSVEPPLSEQATPAAHGKSTAPAPPVVEDCLALRPFEYTETRPNPYTPPSVRAGWGLVASEDLADYLCQDEDVRLSTAALLSARFPFVSPSARLAKCPDRHERDAPATNIVDGGYFDTSAASTIAELWSQVAATVRNEDRPPAKRTGAKPAQRRPCLVPVLLQIDNDYADVTITRSHRPWEITAPLQTLGTGRSTREAQARQTAALQFSRSFATGRDAYIGETEKPIERYAHLYPRAHPGTTAPLGWTLSSSSRADLAAQLRRKENLEELKTIRDWFDPALTCR